MKALKDMKKSLFILAIVGTYTMYLDHGVTRIGEYKQVSSRFLVPTLLIYTLGGPLYMAAGKYSFGRAVLHGGLMVIPYRP